MFCLKHPFSQRNAYFVEGKLEVDKDLWVVSRNAISVLFQAAFQGPFQGLKRGEAISAFPPLIVAVG